MSGTRLLFIEIEHVPMESHCMMSRVLQSGNTIALMQQGFSFHVAWHLEKKSRTTHDEFM